MPTCLGPHGSVPIGTTSPSPPRLLYNRRKQIFTNSVCVTNLLKRRGTVQETICTLWRPHPLHFAFPTLPSSAMSSSANGSSMKPLEQDACPGRPPDELQGLLKNAMPHVQAALKALLQLRTTRDDSILQ